MEDAKSIKLEKHIVRALNKLNELRNQLAHNLEFKITVSDIDNVGFVLGREYLLEKYSIGAESRSLLIWIIEHVASDVFFPVYATIKKNSESASDAQIAKQISAE